MKKMWLKLLDHLYLGLKWVLILASLNLIKLKSQLYIILKIHICMYIADFFHAYWEGVLKAFKRYEP